MESIRVIGGLAQLIGTYNTWAHQFARADQLAMPYWLYQTNPGLVALPPAQLLPNQGKKAKKPGSGDTKRAAEKLGEYADEDHESWTA